MNENEKRLKIEEIFNNLKDFVTKIKTDALISGKKDEASSSVSYIGMIFDEISNSFKKGKSVDIYKISEGLDDELKLKLAGLNALNTKILPSPAHMLSEKLDALSLYCNDVFMELMAGDSCAIPESYKN
jgi:HD superfamily phosphodiesterase